MIILRQAMINKNKGKGFFAKKYRVIWENKNTTWNWIAYEYGIRRSNLWQLIPIRFSNKFTQKILTLGFWKLYFSIIYNKK